MATFNGVVGQQTISYKTVADGNHPAVIRMVEFLSDNGTIKAGEIIAYDTNGKAVSYDPAAVDSKNIPVGVLTEDIDTTTDTAGMMAVHGTLVRAAITVKGASASDANISALESKIPVWAI